MSGLFNAQVQAGPLHFAICLSSRLLLELNLSKLLGNHHFRYKSL